MVYVAPDPCQFEIRSTGFHFAPPLQHGSSMFSPSVPRRAGPRPAPLHPTPTYWPFLRAESRAAIAAPAVVVRAVAPVNGLQHFRSTVSAIWATHLLGPPFFRSSDSVSTETTLPGDQGSESRTGGHLRHRAERLSRGSSRFEIAIATVDLCPRRR